MFLPGGTDREVWTGCPILYLIPIVGLIVAIVVFYDLAKSFGHGVGFTIGLVLLSWIFLLILWLGRSRYLGPAGSPQEASPDGPGNEERPAAAKDRWSTQCQVPGLVSGGGVVAFLATPSLRWLRQP